MAVADSGAIQSDPRPRRPPNITPIAVFRASRNRKLLHPGAD